MTPRRTGDAAKIWSSKCREDSFLEQSHQFFKLGRRTRETISVVERISQINAEEPGNFRVDRTVPLIVETDTSKKGIGAALILGMKTEEGVQRRLIYTAFRSLKSAETRYSTIRRELLGVSLALK